MNTQNTNIQEYININNQIKNLNSNINEFRENEFIVLRNLYSNASNTLNLVIHIESLYIFMMKKNKLPN